MHPRARPCWRVRPQRASAPSALLPGASEIGRKVIDRPWPGLRRARRGVRGFPWHDARGLRLPAKEKTAAETGNAHGCRRSASRPSVLSGIFSESRETPLAWAAGVHSNIRPDPRREMELVLASWLRGSRRRGMRRASRARCSGEPCRRADAQHLFPSRPGVGDIAVQRAVNHQPRHLFYYLFKIKFRDAVALEIWRRIQEIDGVGHAVLDRE